MRSRLSKIAVCLAVGTAVGLSGGTAAVAAPGDQHYKVVATNPTSGSQIKVPLGDRLQLQLTACESCGYAWKVTKKPNAAVIAYVRQLSSVKQSCNGCVGGNATERFLFQSKGVGVTTVALGYFPPGKSKPSKTLRLQLAVSS
jgi:predicted secreted protein